MMTTIDFRSALYELVEYETNPLSKARVRRALRNDRVFDRWHARVCDMALAQQERNGVDAPAATFDFDTLLAWLAEYWDDILKLLLMLFL